MADTNHVRRDDYVEFSENDPFAELTRIMGHDPRVSEPAQQSAPASVTAPAAASAAADDFAIDLERELAGDFDFSDFDDQPTEAADDHAPVADWREETVAYEETASVSLDDAFDDFFANELAPEPAAASPSVQPAEPFAADPGRDDAYAPIDLVDDLALDLAADIDDTLERELHAGEADAVRAEAESAAVVTQSRWDDYGAEPESQPEQATADFAAPGSSEAEENWTADAEFDLDLLEKELEASAAQGAMKVMPRTFEPEETSAPASFHGVPEAREELHSDPVPSAPEQPSAPQSLSLEEELGLLLADDPVPPAPATVVAPHKAAVSPLGSYGRANFASGHSSASSAIAASADSVEAKAPSQPVYAPSSYAQPFASQPGYSPQEEPFAEPAAVAAPVSYQADEAAGEQDDLTDLLGDEFDFDLGFEGETAAPAHPATGRASPVLPDIETVEVSESVQPVFDDLDIPEIHYESAQTAPATPFDDFEADFADVFGDLGRDEPSPAIAPATAAAATVAAMASRSVPAPDMQPYVLDDAQWQAAQAFPDGDLDYESDLEKEISSSVYDDEEARPAPRRRGLVVAAAIAGVAVLGGLGVFGMSMFGGGSDTPALVKADTDPMKVRPENPGGTTVPNQNNEVYQRVAGGSPSAAPAQESLISSTEEPIDVASRTAPVQEPAALAPGIDDEADAGLVKSEDRIEPESSAPLAAEETAMVTPRRVRTMVVRPDGTMVPREEIEPAPAAEAIAPVQAPVQTLDQTLAAAGPLQPVPPAAEIDEGPTVDTPQTVAVVPTQRTEPQAAAPARPAAPAAQPAAQRPVAPAPAPAATPVSAPAAAAPAGATSEWSMQVASQPTAEGAQSTYQDLARRYGSVLEGRGVNIVRADIEGRGTYYRVRIPASSRDEAIQLCTRYKAAGGSCFVSR
jgi:hypothetical protein